MDTLSEKAIERLSKKSITKEQAIYATAVLLENYSEEASQVWFEWSINDFAKRVASRK